MRITRLYHPTPLTCGETTHLDTDASNHLIRVLRTKIGATVVLFNGDGFDYSGRVQNIDAKKTSVLVESKIEVSNESNLSITLIQGLSRNDRMETTIQKSVELGVNKIIPLLSQRSNAKLPKEKQIKKLAHWRKVAISACEQSGRSQIPTITAIQSLHDLHAELDPDALKIILNPESGNSLKDIAFKQQAIEILIGPEGGLNNEEVLQLEDKGFKNICFGPRVLRTETAGPAVISALQMLWGDF